VLTDDVAAAALDALPSFVAVLGPDGTVVRLNEAWRRAAATGVAVVPVRPGASWLAACDAAAESAPPIQTLATLTRQMLDHRRDRGRVEVPQVTPRGRRWLDVRLRTIAGGQGMVVVVDDVTERHDREQALRHRATHDPVTGLPNRLALRERVAVALAHPDPPPDGEHGEDGEDGDPSGLQGEAGTGPHRAAVLFLDLDAFRRINQTFGYTFGDAVLRAAAGRLSGALGAQGALGRWGGDEFVVLAENITSTEAAGLAERLAQSLAEPVTVDGHQIRLSVSIGIALSGAAEAADAAARLRRGAENAALLAADALVGLAGEEVVRARVRARSSARRRSSRRQP
jgi:diguanylate cyclase (GGDEF)-like protein